MFSEMMIMHHLIDTEFFNSDETMFTDEFSACFMQEIKPLVSDLYMLNSETMNRFPSVPGASFPARDYSL